MNHDANTSFKRVFSRNLYNFFCSTRDLKNTKHINQGWHFLLLLR